MTFGLGGNWNCYSLEMHFFLFLFFWIFVQSYLDESVIAMHLYTKL